MKEEGRGDREGGAAPDFLAKTAGGRAAHIAR